MPANVAGSLEIGELIVRIENQIFEALDDALDHVATVGERHAKRLAPVRKVSEITRRRGAGRALSRAEVASLPASIRRGAESVLRSGGSYRQTTRRSEQTLEAPEVESVEDLRTGVSNRLKNRDSESFLTYRGQAELREAGRRPPGIGVNLMTGETRRTPGTSAIFTRTSRTPDKFGRMRESNTATLGGRLRGEIRAVKGATTKGKIRYDIVSPTPYARFVEFPTSRTAAQPYMRPTLKFLKRPMIAAVYRELKRRGFRPEPI